MGVSGCLTRIRIKSTVCRVWYEHTIQLQFFFSCKNLSGERSVQEISIDGFRIFPYIVASLHKILYIELYQYCRRTLLRPISMSLRGFLETEQNNSFKIFIFLDSTVTARVRVVAVATAALAEASMGSGGNGGCGRGGSGGRGRGGGRGDDGGSG